MPHSIFKTFFASSLALVNISLSTDQLAVHAQETSKDAVTPWVEDGQLTLAKRRTVKPNKRKAKNVILFVADGMDPTTIAAARIYDGQTRGEQGEENFLSFEHFPHLAMAKTYNTDFQTPDSAGTMSAMMTGVKTKSGIISLSDAVKTNVCASSKGAYIANIGELAEQAGLSTGVISTARLTHATPAAVYAHAANREWEADHDLSKEAVENGCKDIASQLIDFPYGDGLEIAMGGGRRNFLPNTVNDPEDKGKKGSRTDERNLVEEWKQKSDNHVFAFDKESFNTINTKSGAKILGLFERSHMQYELDRTNEPSLSEMTSKAIDLLSTNKKGYFLMVEAGRVDHAHHGSNARRALHDPQAFANAVQTAIDKTNNRDTLIIVTADHGHTLTFAGYPAKGNDILGLVRTSPDPDKTEQSIARASDGKAYTTLTYANGPGAVVANGDKFQDGRPAITDEIVANKNYQQQGTVPTRSETHGGQDVTIYASGPHAYLFGGIVEQSYVFHVIEAALKLKKRAKK